MILVDISNLLYKTLFVQEDPNNVQVDDILNNVIKELRYIEDTFSADYGRIIICSDSKTNWRKTVFPLYKQNRTIVKAKDDKDWNYIYAQFDKAVEEIKNHTIWVVLKVDDLEADDIMALCCKYSPEKVLIYSIDKDLNQLVDGRKVKQFSYKSQDYVSKNTHLLKEAILTGDSSDGVPNIFSDDDHYTREDKVRAKPVTSFVKDYFQNLSTITESNISSFVDYYNENKKDTLDKEKIISNFKRNRSVIDLSMIPDKYTNVFKSALKEAIKEANTHKDIFEEWCDSKVNDFIVDESKPEEIGDLFD